MLSKRAEVYSQQYLLSLGVYDLLRQKWSGTVHKTLKVVVVASAILIALISSSQKADVSQWSWPLAASFVLSLKKIWWSVPLLAGMGGAAKVIGDSIGPPVLWSTIQFVLDQYQEELFSDKEPHLHRVTLYRHVRFHWGWRPFSGWMVPVARSGHTGKSRIPKFRASDNAPEKAEGIAGQAWVQKKLIMSKDLPNIDGTSTTEDDLNSYAEKGFVSRAWLDRRLKLSKRKEKINCRSFLGIQVKVKGIPWGALVIDSKDPEGDFIELAQGNKRCSTLIDTLSKLLSAGKE